MYIYLCETCTWTPNTCFLSKIAVKINAVRIQVEAERDVYSSSALIGVSADTSDETMKLYC